MSHPRHWNGFVTEKSAETTLIRWHNRDIDAMQSEIDTLTAQLTAALEANRQLLAERNATTCRVAITPDDPRYAEFVARLDSCKGDEACKPTAFDRERFVRIAKDQLDQIINAIKEIRP